MNGNEVPKTLFTREKISEISRNLLFGLSALYTAFVAESATAANQSSIIKVEQPASNVGAGAENAEKIAVLQERMKDFIQSIGAAASTEKYNEAFAQGADLRELLNQYAQTPFIRELAGILDALALKRSTSDTETLMDFQDADTNLDARERQIMQETLDALQELIKPYLPKIDEGSV